MVPSPGVRKLEFVRVRDGRRSLHWPGLFACVLLTTAVGLAVGWTFDAVLRPGASNGFWSALRRALILAVFLTAFFALKVWNKLGLALPESERRPRT